jgi:hypothetical protein
MKTPRVSDFDPNAAPPLRSPMDDLPAIEAPKKVNVPPSATAVAPQLPSTNQRTNDDAVVATNERRKIRHTFDILADQLLALREIAIEREKTFGKRVLLGDLAQAALDMFIARERNKE